MGGALCLLVIGCANVANLLLVQAAVRQREFAIRASLGGVRWWIVRQWLVDALVIAGLGAIQSANTFGNPNGGSVKKSAPSER
ncbi:MAG: hypothetical protein ABR606_10600 [Vicinamibacterales bacterium]